MTESEKWGIIIPNKKTFIAGAAESRRAVKEAFLKSDERLVITMVVTKQSVIGDVLDHNPDLAQFFLAIGMHCLYCPPSQHA